MNAPFAPATRPFVGRHAAARYRILLRQDRYLSRARVDASWVPDFGLAVRARRMPLEAFTTCRLFEGEPWWPTFTPRGEALWAIMRDLGDQALREMGAPPGSLVAIFLDPQAITTARDEAIALRAN